MTTSAAVYWSIPELFARVKNHNYAFGDLSLLIIPVELARTGRIHAIGRRCDDTGEPETQWTPIPCHEWGDLHIPSRSRRPPHYSDDVFWSSSGRRAWASVQFSEEDLLREWLGDVFARPRAEPIGDVVIPPIRDTPTAVMPPLPASSKHRGARSPALPTKCDTDGLYVERLRTFQKEHRYLSRSDDERDGRAKRWSSSTLPSKSRSRSSTWQENGRSPPNRHHSMSYTAPRRKPPRRGRL